MMKKFFLLGIALLISAVSRGEVVKGSVRSTEGRPLAGVVVSDGLNVVQTDSNGLFSLEVDKESGWVFVSTPSGYRSSVTGGELEYFKKIDKGVGSYDFLVEKKRSDDTNHNIIVIADPQISDRDELPELKLHAKDIADYVSGIGDDETFGICLGDIVGWDHSIYPEYNKIMQGTGIEFRNVIGNHDMTNYGRSYETSLRNYEQMYGPCWYSFNVGKVHYVVLNDNFFIGTDWYYIGYVDERQLQWLEKDLSYVPKNHKVVLSLHIPTTLSDEDRKSFNYEMISELVSNKKAIYEMLKPYDAIILSGHMHTANTQNISKKLTEINVTGLSGAWWCGPVCVDGSPAGYKVIEVRGDKMEWIYKGSGHSLDYQFKLYVGHEAYPGQIVANVWDYDTLWRVEYFEDGVKVCDMERFKAQDPQALELYKDPSTLKRQWVWAVPTQNMFKANISKDAKVLEVRVTDRFGRVYVKSVEQSCTQRLDVGVLVVGGGASGVAAGVQSARMGAQTLIIEETPWLGGMLTAAGVSCVDGNYNLRGGIFGEFADSLCARYGGWDGLKTGWVSHINFEPHVGQEIFSNMTGTCAGNLEVLRETKIIGLCKLDDGGWRVEAQSADGKRVDVRASVLIDCTELGDIAKMCGVQYSIGMDSRDVTGESIAPQSSNDIIQDLTYVAILKDYGPDSDMTISKPEGYDKSLFGNCAINPLNTVSETGQTIWPPENMITYGALPNGKYMINWPIYGNDYYVNSIEMTPEQRNDVYSKAKDFTRCFIYFIQTELGMKHLGLADDEFPTADKMPFFPYHRESRRIEGEVLFTMDAAQDPYGYKVPYYRTGIAVGDYAVDHHHFRHPNWRTLPDLHFYPIPSFNVPAGVLVPKNVEDLIVAEKSVSVSNLVNGTTRLQPVVMQLGQAAGAMAAISVKEGKSVRNIDIRRLQSALLESGGYIMPYLDLPRDHSHFVPLQKIGATGILRGEGRNVGWANQTWFRADDPLKYEELYFEEYFNGVSFDKKGTVTVGNFSEMINGISVKFGKQLKVDSTLWNALKLENYSAGRAVTRGEAAVVIDTVLDPFNGFSVDFNGYLKGAREKRVEVLPISGTFINLAWQDTRNKYTNPKTPDCTDPKLWETKIEELHQMGIEYLVFMAVANEGKAFYPSSIMPKSYPQERESPVSAIMDAAASRGMKVFMSTGWAKDQDDNLRNPSIKQRQMEIMEELAALYGNHKAFYGWYLPVEDCLGPVLTDYAVEAVNALAERARECTPGKKVLISPYGIFKSDFDDPDYEKQISRLKVDIIAYQDEVGCVREEYPISRLKENWKRLRAIHNKLDIEMWANCESFTWEKGTNDRSSALVPAHFSRVLSQLSAASEAGVERIISFIICGMWDNPNSPYPLGQPVSSSQLYEDYTSWLAGDNFWKAAEQSIANGAEENPADSRWIHFEEGKNEYKIDLKQNDTGLLVRILNYRCGKITPPERFVLYLSEDGERYWRDSEGSVKNFPNNLHDAYIDYILFEDLPKNALSCKIVFEGEAYCSFNTL